MISIITATYNSAINIGTLIASLEQQTSREFEWIVIDGASSDDTLKILAAANIEKLTVISEPDRGIYDALNKGISLSNFEYYLIAGSDDYLQPDAIASYSAVLRQREADLITAPVLVGDITIYPQPRFSRYRSGPPTVSSHSVGTVIRKRLHETFGPYSLDYAIAADTLFLRKVIRSPETRIVFLHNIAGRFGTEGCSSKNRLRTLTDSFRANIEAGENLALQWLLFSCRLIKNWSRIRKDTSSDER